jgi:hypothetical protein
MRFFILLFLCAASVGAIAQPKTPEKSSTDVIQVSRTFKDGGEYDNKWGGSGVPEEITFKGEKILRAGQGTYCCGLTFAVAMKVAEARGLLRDKTPVQIRKFQKEWYGATEDSKEIECVLAVKNLGIGKAVSFDEAKPGDFVQFWRTKTGHSVIFLNWIERNGEKIGFRYRSSQLKTKGIGDVTEYFQGNPDKPNDVNKARTYFCRLNEK